MPEITRGPVHLFYDDLGAGPAVLLSHSWFCDGRQWPQVDTFVSAGHRVLNLDNRGHGRSGPYRGRFTTWDMADDLIAVLDDAGVGEAVLVGLSIGGFAALRAALRHPDRVRALVLSDTGAGAASWPDRAKAIALGPMWLTPARSLVLPMLVKLLFGPTARREQPDLVAEWRLRFLDQDPRSMRAALRAVVARDDISPQLPEVAKPTLVIVGEEDDNPGVTAATALAAGIAGARLVVLPDTGHLSALERPDAFGDEALRFLDAL
jgi:3-oxoadipate enol-lactonase